VHVRNRLRERQEWKFFGALPRANPALATAWWTILVLRGPLPAAFAIAMGALKLLESFRRPPPLVS
jgi:ATP-binding cassette, subfamily B, bacterial